jgi:hypothetical protein
VFPSLLALAYADSYCTGVFTTGFGFSKGLKEFLKS